MRSPNKESILPEKKSELPLAVNLKQDGPKSQGTDEDMIPEKIAKDE